MPREIRRTGRPSAEAQERIAVLLGCCWFSLCLSLALTLAPSSAAVADSAALPQARGVVTAAKAAKLASDLGAIAVEIGYREGERFEQGAQLVRFDCRRHRAELASLEAQTREKQAEFKSNEFLEKRGAVARADLETSHARFERAGHEADVLRIRLERCEITAPYAGRVQTLKLNPHETPPAGQPFMEIISEGALEVELIAPSAWMSWLREGTPFQFTIDETGTTHSATVERIGAVVDAVSQTVKVFGQFDPGTSGVRAGMSGAARFSSAGG